MNLFAFLFIILTVGASEWMGFEVAESWPSRTVAVALVAALVPAVALFQTGILLQAPLRRNQNRFSESDFRRLNVAHSLVWLTAAMAIVWGLRWQDVVRGNWGLSNCVLIDELLILTPALIGIFASWLIFFELYRVSTVAGYENGSSQSTDFPTWRNASKQALRRLKPRLEFAWLRFRFYLFPPLLIFAALRLLLALSQQLVHGDELWSQLGLIVCFLSLVIALPFLMLLIWNTEPIRDLELAERLDAHSRENRMDPWQIRCWNTGFQLANAAVIGVLPRLRLVLVSDVVLRAFPTAELDAVVRHEAGHIRGRHACWKFSFMALPILAMMMHQPWLSQSGTFFLDLSLGERVLQLVVSPPWGIFLLATLIMTTITSRWLNHQCEFEADLYAIKASGVNEVGNRDAKNNLAIDVTRWEAMKMALYRFAAFSGDEMNRSSFFHPSIQRRIEMLDQFQANPETANRSVRQNVRGRFFVLLGWFAMTVIGWAITTLSVD